MGELWRRLWYLLNRSRLERELREEMDAHRAMKGESGPRFGNPLKLREEASDVWGWAWLDRLAQDVRFGVRLLVRAPLFTLTAILVLSLGVGVNLGAFQVLDAVAFRPLPVTSPERLVKLTRRHPRGSSTSFSYPSFDFYRTHGGAIASGFALSSATVTLGDADTRRVEIEFVTGNYFSDLGAHPLEGRLIDAMDDRAGASPVIVLGERMWRSRFGADPSLVGRSLKVNGHPFVVAGVVPDSFAGLGDGGGSGSGAWAPIAQHRIAFPGSTLVEDDRDRGALRFYARLRDGVTLEQAQAALVPTARALHTERPDAAPPDEWVHLSPAGTYLPLDSANPAALALASALVLLLLVTACMNLGLLVLARTLSRDREFSIRLSVGASRGRILRQLVTEQLLLACAGGLAGVCVAALATKLFGVFTDMPAGIVPRLTLRSAAVAMVLSALSALLFGFAPVLQSIRPAVSRRVRARTVLVGVQVAAAMVLLIVSALIVRGITRVVRVPLGFDYRQAAVLNPDLTSHGATPARAQAYWAALEQRVARVPGVEGFALTTLPPFGNRVTINKDRTVLYGVTPSYFTTMGIRVVRGRIFQAGEPKVVVVGESLARRAWPGEDPIGKSYDGSSVIGLVNDARSVRIGDRTTTECYYAIRASELPVAVMVIRATNDPRAVAAPLMEVARAEDAGVLPTIVLLPDALESRLESVRQFAYVASTLGLSALLLAVTGLGGMVAFTVSQRLREIGVRVALGAGPRHVLGAIVRQFAWPIGLGAAGGSILAAGVGTIMARELFGVSQFDPIAHGGAFLLFASVAAVAALPSLRRAIRLNPIEALRHE